MQSGNILRRREVFRQGEDIMSNEVVHDQVRETHAHEFYEIACILSGSGEHHVGTEIQPIRENDVLLMNPYIPHAYIPTPGNALYICNVTFTENAVSAHLEHQEAARALSLFLRLDESRLLKGVGRLDRQYGITIIQLMREMAAEYFARRPGYQLTLQGMLLTLLIRLLRESDGGEIQAQDPDVKVWQSLFPAFRLIYDHGGANLKVQQLADKAGWSVDHFSRMFKQATGETVQRYMRLIRVRRAASLLLTSPKSVDNIATVVGYADAKSFRRAFFTCVGMTPDAYRRRHA